MSQASHAAAAANIQKTTQAPVSGSASPSARDVPSHEQIAKLAYQFWEERGRPEGSADEDWLRAERQIFR